MRTLDEFAYDATEVVSRLDDERLGLLCLVLNTVLVSRLVSAQRGLPSAAAELFARAGTTLPPAAIFGADCSRPPP